MFVIVCLLGIRLFWHLKTSFTSLYICSVFGTTDNYLGLTFILLCVFIPICLYIFLPITHFNAKCQLWLHIIIIAVMTLFRPGVKYFEKYLNTNTLKVWNTKYKNLYPWCIKNTNTLKVLKYCSSERNHPVLHTTGVQCKAYRKKITLIPN